MMAYFADFTGKLSHGVYKMPPNDFNLGWSADRSVPCATRCTSWAGSS